MNTFTKVIVILVAVVAVLIGAGYYAVFHSSLPPKLFLGFIEKGDPKWTFDDISGSISSGITIGEMTYTRPDDRSRVSRLNDIGFRYEKNDDTLILKSVHLKSGHIFIDPQGEDFQGAYTSETIEVENDYPQEEPPVSESFNEEEIAPHPIFEKTGIKRLVLENIDINDLTIEDPKTGQKTHIAAIKSTGFTVSENEFLFGSFDIRGDHVTVKIEPVDDITMERSSVIGLDARIDDRIHSIVNRDIDLTCTLDCSKLPVRIDTLQAMGGAIRMESVGRDEKRFTIYRLTPADYISYDGIPPFNGLNLKGAYHYRDEKKTALVINGGDFRLGDAFFKIDPARIDMENSGDPGNVVTARSTYDGVDYTMLVTSYGKMKFDISSEPAMTQDEIRVKLNY